MIVIYEFKIKVYFINPSKIDVCCKHKVFETNFLQRSWERIQIDDTPMLIYTNRACRNWMLNVTKTIVSDNLSFSLKGFFSLWLHLDNQLEHWAEKCLSTWKIELSKCFKIRCIFTQYVPLPLCKIILEYFIFICGEKFFLYIQTKTVWYQF